VQRHIDSAREEEALAPGVAVVRALGSLKPARRGSESVEATKVAGALELPRMTPAQRRRRVAFKVAAVLSLALHAGSLYAFLAWHGSADTGALDRPSDAISVEIVQSLTVEAREPRQASEPAPSVAATAPTEGSTEASDAQPVEPERKVEPEPRIVVPQPPLVVPDAQEQVMRAVKRETPTRTEAPPVPEQGPTEAVPPPPNSGSSEDDAPAKRQPQKQKVREHAAQSTPKGGQISKSSDGKGRGGERVSASSGAMLSYAAEVRARVAGNKPSGGGLRGTAVVAFGLPPSGGLAFASLARSSGDVQLDQLAVAAVRGSAPFPPPPAGATSAQLRFSIPFHFQ
jgi:periplasmic protein TonB